MLRPWQFLTVLTSRSLSHTGVVQIAPHFQQPILRTSPFLGADFPRQRSHKTMEKTQHFAQFLPAKSSRLTSLLHHVCTITSLGWQIFSNNSQYSRKLDSKLPLISPALFTRIAVSYKIAKNIRSLKSCVCIKPRLCFYRVGICNSSIFSEAFINAVVCMYVCLHACIYTCIWTTFVYTCILSSCALNFLFNAT